MQVSWSIKTVNANFRNRRQGLLAKSNEQEQYHNPHLFPSCMAPDDYSNCTQSQKLRLVA